MIRRLARPMLATVFVIDGVETLRNPHAHVADAAPLVEKAAPLVEKGEQAVNERVAPTVPPVPKDPETLVKALAGVKIGAGVLFAMGKAPRLSALALTASHLPSTVSRHAFWTESDSAARSRKMTGLATDVSLLGALILASVDTAGQPGLAWRTRKASDKVAAKLPGAKAEAVGAGAAVAGVAHTVADQARDAAGTVREKAPVVADQVRTAADTVRDRAPEVAEQVRDRAPEVAEQVRGQASGFAGLVMAKAPVIAAQVRNRLADAREQAAPYAAEARDRATAAAHLAAEEAGPLAAQARERAEAVAGNVAGRVEEFDTAAVRKTAKDARKTAEKRALKTEKRASKAGADARKKSDELRAKAAKAIKP